jgi:ribosomal protein L37AE/L43A
VDPRVFKERVAGFLSVGGAATADWTSMTLPLLYFFTFTMDMSVVDMYQALAAAQPGQIALNDDAVARAGKLGRNVAQAMGKKKSEIEYMGDDPGTCPVCHCNLMVVGSEPYIECAICGIKGGVELVDGKIKVTFSEKEQAVSHLTREGMLKHFFEIGDVQAAFDKGKEELPAKLEKYKAYKPAWK